MIAAYVRVSSASQTLDSQVSAITESARARGHVVDQWFRDVVSGNSSERHGLNEFLAGARAGKFTVVYIYRVDRVSRAGILPAFRVVEDIRATGCIIISVADPFQVDGPFGDLVLAVLAYGAQVERENIRQRQASARKALESEGKTWGRPPSISILQRQLIWEGFEQGLSMREIAMKVKVPRSSVHRVILDFRPSQNPPDESPPTERSISEKSDLHPLPSH